MGYTLLISSLTTIISIIIGGVVGILTSKIKNLKNEKTTTDTNLSLLMKGQMQLLKMALKQDHEKYMADGYCPLEEKEEIDALYQTYHNLGGNGFGTKLRNDIMALPNTKTKVN